MAEKSGRGWEVKLKGEGEQGRVKSLSSRAEFKNPFSNLNLRLELKVAQDGQTVQCHFTHTTTTY